MKNIVNKVKYDKAGLIPAIMQDYKTGEVLMLAYMNKESLKLTIKTKKATFYSRSRKKLWLKGETSGNIQKVKEMYFDCDLDAVLIKIDQIGGSACHTGYKSCFFSKLGKTGLKTCGKRVFDPKKVYGK